MNGTAFTFPDPTKIPPPHRCILHWTAGTYISSPYERGHYHALIEWEAGNIRVVSGVPITNNLHQLTMESPTYASDPSGYAAHTRGFNSWSLGFAVCAMYGALDTNRLGNYPVLPEQIDGLITLCAQASVVFGLQVDEDHFFTHWEAGYLHGVSQPGKWDITWAPQIPDAAPEEVGPWIRQQIEQRI
jgi:hypothetical protein